MTEQDHQPQPPAAYGPVTTEAVVPDDGMPVTDEILDLHPRFRAIADYLAAKAPPGQLPGRQHIEPLDLAAHLRFINLIDVVYTPAGLRFRFRLMGSEQVQANGRDFSGRFCDEILSPADLAWVTRRMGAAVMTRMPDYAERVLPHPGRDHVRYRRILFPLARDGETVDMLLAIHVYL